MPRPIEIKFKVSLFVHGGNSGGMDASLKLAKDFEEMLEGKFLQGRIGQRLVLAIEVLPNEEKCT